MSPTKSLFAFAVIYEWRHGWLWSVYIHSMQFLCCGGKFVWKISIILPQPATGSSPSKVKITKSPSGLSWRNDRSWTPAFSRIESVSFLFYPTIWLKIVTFHFSFFFGKITSAIAIIAIKLFLFSNILQTKFGFHE